VGNILLFNTENTFGVFHRWLNNCPKMTDGLNDWFCDSILYFVT